MAKTRKRVAPKTYRRIRKRRTAMSSGALRKERPVVTISKQEYEGLKETIYLLSNPANAQELLAGIAEADAGKFEEHELLNE